MSRTIRKLPMSRTSRNVKWYGAAFDSNDYQLLKNPPSRVNTNRVYETKTINDTHTVYEHSRKGVPGAKRLQWVDWWMSHKGIEEGDWFIARQEEYTNTYRSRVYDSTRHLPGQDTPQDEWEYYQHVHNYVYRNGTCRRQRKNAVRFAKMAASRKQRIESQELVRSELAAFYEEANYVSSE